VWLRRRVEGGEEEKEKEDEVRRVMTGLQADGG